ncbi:MAG TPA: protein translocase subunit SecD [Solirubrobacterales bacterium]|nr:protein translocase subunit SecD [Solirubrobacterales bacterium]
MLLFVAGLVLASLWVISTKDTKLGLDLSGGTELIYQGRPTPQNPEIDGDDIDRSIEIIRERTDSLGVSEPEISRLGTDSVRVGLPDVQNAQRAIDQVGDTAQLFFYDWEPNVIPNPNVPADRAAESPFPRLYDAVVLASQQQPSCVDDKCTTAGPTFYLFDSQTKQPISGPESTRDDLFADLAPEDVPPEARQEILTVPQGTVVVRQEPPEDNPDTEEKENEQTDNLGFYVIKDVPALSGDDIRNPEQQTDPTTNQPNVTFEFTDEGRLAFEDVTKGIAERGLQNAPPGISGNAAAASQYSGHFAVVLDNEIVSRPIINFVENPAGIDGRTGAQIEGSFNIQEAQDLAEFLKIGALPIELKLISQSTVSATLGEQALDQGLKAGLAGVIVVLLFLIAYYRFLGVVAALGLLLYGIFFYALIELIPITLTLPGIAGLILTIGVAADSNVVIFERIKEEARAGKSMRSAIATGYRKGIATIIDANVITLITAFILFVLSTASVKGFAFTLGVGTIASLFTAVVFTQAFLGLFGGARFMSSPSLLGAGEERVRWHFDFTGMSKYFFSFSGAILLISAISFATLQFNLGLDFQSGSRITAGLAEEASVEDVRSVLEGAGIQDAEITEAQNDELGQNVFQIEADIEPEQVREVQPALESNFGLVENGFDSTSVGPTFGEQVARSAVYAIIFSLLVICAYIAFRFEPKYAVPVIIAVIHDILITGGVYSLAEREVTSGTVAAFLTILGYSLYDTVIVFDRIRENVPRLPRATFSQIVNRSMSEVLTRSLITGLSSVFLVTVLYIFGSTTLQDFAFAMMVGIASGTYSSIFIAAPVLTAWKEREPAYRRRRERIEEQMGYVPAFPEENVIARVEGHPEAADEAEPAEAGEPAPEQARAPEPQPPAPVKSSVPGVLPEPPAPVAPAPEAEPEPRRPAAETGEQAQGEREDDGKGDGLGEKPELSEASAAALRRVREGRGGKGGRRKRKHGRPR